MSDETRLEPGTVCWRDLTVPDAEAVRDFYSAVVGWKSRGEDMGGYQDFNMVSPNGETVAGICHARGVNADVPPQWLLYIVVEDMDRSVAACVEKGGRIVTGPRLMGKARFCVVQDPAGATCTLFQP